MNINTKWKRDGINIAGGNGRGNALNQFSSPKGIYVDDNDQKIYIADYSNNRIVEWKYRAKNGHIVAGGNRKGNRMDQLDHPRDVVVDHKNDSLIVCDHKNRRVVRWSRRNGANGTIVAGENGRGKRLDQLNDPSFLFVDEDHSVYVSDWGNNRVMKWMKGAKEGIVVAGGQGQGNSLTQLYSPEGVILDQRGNVCG
jgi:sugar lactone lactonase YvrE